VAPVVTPAHRTIHVVRHAKAFSRKRYDGDDTHRPLSEEGRSQAEALAERFDEPPRVPIDRVSSSGAVRCVETVSPLAAHRGLEVEHLDDLGEGSPPAAALRSLVELASESPAGGGIVACSHGDVIFGLLVELVATGLELSGPLSVPKGSVWELTVGDGQVVAAGFRPPP